MTRAMVALCMVAACFAALADAQSVVVPNAYTTLAGTGGNNSLTREQPRTFQFGIAASQLTAIPPGAVITGVSFRSNNSSSNPATWPAADIAWKNYDIYLAEAAVPLSQFSTTFANNMKNPVQVRSGPMTIRKGSFSKKYASGTIPNPFDNFYFDFKKHYIYMGGDLVLFIDHDGNTASTYFYLNYTASSAATHGITQMASGTYQAKTATSTNYSFVIHRFHFGYGPAGCTGVNGDLNLILSNDLVAPTPPPGTINIAVTNGWPSAPGGLVVAFTQSPTPLPLPGGCKLLVLPPILALIPFALDGNGRYDLNLTFPAVTLGTVAVQAYAVDPGPAGYVVTNGINLTVKT